MIKINLLPKEEWRFVPGQPDLLVSDWGRFEKLARYRKTNGQGFRLDNGVPSWGTFSASSGPGKIVCLDAFGKTTSLPRLICLAFHGEPPPGKPVCMHVDENFRNNRPENLKWGTQRENLNCPKFIEYRRLQWTGENNPQVKAKKKRLLVSGNAGENVI